MNCVPSSEKIKGRSSPGKFMRSMTIKHRWGSVS